MKNQVIRWSLTCAALALSAANAYAVENCQPSRWGADDEIGNANLLTPESVLAASRLIKTGKTYSLGITVDSTTPAFPPRSLSLQIVQPGQQEGLRPFSSMTYNDDIFQGWFGIGPQIDGLGHLGVDGLYYNCNHARDFADITGLTKLGIEKVPPIVARGIVLDMARHFDVEYLAGGQTFTVDDVMAVERRQNTPVREGDVVLFHTGWTDAKLTADPDTWVSVEPGISEAVARYLADKNVVAVGADTWGVDVVPSEREDKPFIGHQILLQANGIYIFETMNTGPLVRDDAFEFLFVLGHAKVRGAVQMIINPIAIR
jgi:kynurenine formamidase